jgi:hypothetical protein
MALPRAANRGCATPAAAIVNSMYRPRRPLTVLACLAALLAAATLPWQASAAATTPSMHRLLVSKELWATIDVCSPTDQPNTVGIRGSMPGDRQPSERMYMSFRLQYLDHASNRWLDLSHGATPRFVSVGAAGSARQGGRSFQLVPVAGRPAFTLRGVVDFQWRRGSRALQSAVRITAAGHQSLAGADPASFTAATCVIG